jgi:hypothetical protein
MVDPAVIPAALDEFFRRWEASTAAERANYSMYLNELCDLLEVPRPDPAESDDEENGYVFERAVPFPNPDHTTAVKRIDFDKRDYFVLEAKQGNNKAAEPEAFALSPRKNMRRVPARCMRPVVLTRRGVDRWHSRRAGSPFSRPVCGFLPPSDRRRHHDSG